MADGALVDRPICRSRVQRCNATGAQYVLHNTMMVSAKSVVAPLFPWLSQAAQRLWARLGWKGQMEFAGLSDLQFNTLKSWHRDSPWAPDPHPLYRLIVYLEDHSIDDGGLLVVPGSHANSSLRAPSPTHSARHRLDPWFRRTPTALEDAAHPGVRLLRPAAGDGLLIDHRVLHRGGDINGSTSPRRVLQYSFGAMGAAATHKFQWSQPKNNAFNRAKCLPHWDVCICYEPDETISPATACGGQGWGTCGRCGPMPDKKKSHSHAHHEVRSAQTQSKLQL